MFSILRGWFGRKPEVDEVYIFDDGSEENPFLEDDNKNLVIIKGIKNGWVEYVPLKENMLAFPIKRYHTITMFRILYKLYKK